MTGSEQLTFTTLGGETVTVKPRGKHYVEPRGYADRPGTGPAGETCKSCCHSYHGGTGRGGYPKCELTRACHTSSRRTDILMGAPACSKWASK
jgi:hypothetical protein